MVDCTKQNFFFGLETFVVCYLFVVWVESVVDVCSHFGLEGFDGCRWIV